MTGADGLAGRRLLIVEDEAMVALMMEDLLTDFGCVVLAVAGSVAAGLDAIAVHGGQLDGAVLDVNLGGEKVFPVAERLQALRIPFLFATGYGRPGLEGRFDDCITLAKPFPGRRLRAALLEALGQA